MTLRSWNNLPMPNSVISRVNQLGSGQPSSISFQDHLVNDVGNDVFSPSYSPPTVDYDIPTVVDQAVKIPGVDLGHQNKTLPPKTNMILTLIQLNQRCPLSNRNRRMHSNP